MTTNEKSKAEGKAPEGVKAPHPGETLKQPIPADPIPVTSPAAAKKRAVEEIARERGLFPEFSPGVPPRKGVKVPPVHNPKFAVFARAKITHQWPEGMELTDAEFDAALEVSEGHKYF